MSARSRHTVLGIGLPALLLETVVQEPFFTTSKIALFKVTTPRDTIVIGLSRDELDNPISCNTFHPPKFRPNGKDSPLDRASNLRPQRIARHADHRVRECRYC